MVGLRRAWESSLQFSIRGRAAAGRPLAVPPPIKRRRPVARAYALACGEPAFACAPPRTRAAGAGRRDRARVRARRPSSHRPGGQRCGRHEGRCGWRVRGSPRSCCAVLALRRAPRLRSADPAGRGERNMRGHGCRRGQRCVVRTWSTPSRSECLLRPPSRTSPPVGRRHPPPAWVDPVAPRGSRVTRLLPRAGRLSRRLAPRSESLRPRRPARERVPRQPPLARRPCRPDRTGAAHPQARAPHDRANTPTNAAQPLSPGERRVLTGHRTKHAAVRSRSLCRQVGRRAQQRSNEHHREHALAEEHHASHLLGGRTSR